MNCKICNIDIGDENFCKNCNIDMILYDKITKISNYLYNKGLYQAKLKNLFDAIDLLNKSLYFNKNNYNSRNLLGLIYFHLGRVGEAIKHWIISSSIKKDNNIALEYIKIIEKNEREIEDLNNAVENYNQALIYIKQKNDDLAVIQLKKSIELNQNFIDAINLLTFCYLIQNRKEEAEILILKSLKIDENNSIALYYYRQMFPNKKTPTKEADIIINKVEPKSNQLSLGNYTKLNSKTSKKKFRNNFSISEVISFALGIIISIFFMYVLVIPGSINNKENKIIKLENDLYNLEKKYKDFTLASEEKIKALEENNNNLLYENETFKNKIYTKKVEEIIKQANNLYIKGYYENAADILFELDETKILEDDSMKNYVQIKTKAYKMAAKNLYIRGIREYNLKNYDKAKQFFEKSLKYSLEDVDYIANEIYCLATIEEKNNNINLALEYYKKIIDNYPKYPKYNIVKEKLDILQQ